MKTKTNRSPIEPNESVTATCGDTTITLSIHTDGVREPGLYIGYAKHMPGLQAGMNMGPFTPEAITAMMQPLLRYAHRGTFKEPPVLKQTGKPKSKRR